MLVWVACKSKTSFGLRIKIKHSCAWSILKKDQFQNGIAIVINYSMCRVFIWHMISPCSVYQLLFVSFPSTFIYFYISIISCYFLFIFLQPHNDGKYVFDIGCEQHGHYEYIEKVKNEQNQLEQ